MGSLLDDLGDTAPASRPPREPVFARLQGSIAARAARTRAWAWATPKSRTLTIAVFTIATMTGGTSAYLALRPTPKPDYEFADLDTVFDYTLLTDEFNNLPVEERLALIRQLIERLRSMGGGESPMLAAFAAGIAGAARDQLEENISRLALDSFDILALEYDTTASPADRTEIAEQSFVEIQKFFESIAGFERDLTDEERLAEGRRQAGRDMERLQSGAVSSNEAGRLFSFMNESIGRHASPHQKARATVLLRDMIRVMRDQDVTTGKPRRGP